MSKLLFSWISGGVLSALMAASAQAGLMGFGGFGGTNFYNQQNYFYQPYGSTGFGSFGFYDGLEESWGGFGGFFEDDKNKFIKPEFHLVSQWNDPGEYLKASPSEIVRVNEPSASWLMLLGFAGLLVVRIRSRKYQD